jgi:hypothetical protein
MTFGSIAIFCAKVAFFTSKFNNPDSIFVVALGCWTKKVMFLAKAKPQTAVEGLALQKYLSESHLNFE